MNKNKRAKEKAAAKTAERTVQGILARQRELDAAVSVARAEAATEARTQTLTEVERTIASATPTLAPQSQPRALAYAFNQPYAFTTPMAPNRPPKKNITLDMMRQLADTYDILRSCIEQLKRETNAVPLEIAARDPKDNSPRMKQRLKAARELFARDGAVGGFGNRRSHFEKQMLEDVLVVGACAIFHHPTRGGGTYQSFAIDALTIRPVVDAYGWPAEGDAAYEQYIDGVQVAAFSRDRLTYDGLYPVSYSPYFKSPIEYLVRVINAALRADQWNTDWLTDGNTPSDMLALPDGWTPDQIKEYLGVWDAMLAGNSKQRQKTKFVPGGSQRVGNPSRKDQDFQAFELWLLRRTCAIMGVSPASIGFEGEQYKVAQEGSRDATSAIGVGALLDFRKEQYDDLLARFGFDDLEVQNVTKREEKAKEKAETNQVLIQSGQRTINEVRAEDGLDPIEGGDVLLVSKTLVSLENSLAPPEPQPVPGNPDDGSDDIDDDDDLPPGDNGDDDKNNPPQKRIQRREPDVKKKATSTP